MCVVSWVYDFQSNYVSGKICTEHVNIIIIYVVNVVALKMRLYSLYIESLLTQLESGFMGIQRVRCMY